MNGWGKIRATSEYAGVSMRTLRDWLKSGLRHSRLPTGTILIRFSAIDEFLESFSTDQNQVDEIVENVCKEMDVL